MREVAVRTGQGNIELYYEKTPNEKPIGYVLLDRDLNIMETHIGMFPSIESVVGYIKLQNRYDKSVNIPYRFEGCKIYPVYFIRNEYTTITRLEMEGKL